MGKRFDGLRKDVIGIPVGWPPRRLNSSIASDSGNLFSQMQVIALPMRRQSKYPWRRQANLV